MRLGSCGLSSAYDRRHELCWCLRARGNTCITYNYVRLSCNKNMRTCFGNSSQAKIYKSLYQRERKKQSQHIMPIEACIKTWQEGNILKKHIAFPLEKRTKINEKCLALCFQARFGSQERAGITLAAVSTTGGHGTAGREGCKNAGYALFRTFFVDFEGHKCAGEVTTTKGPFCNVWFPVCFTSMFAKCARRPGEKGGTRSRELSNCCLLANN